MTTKAFPIDGVLGVVTGINLNDYGRIIDVMDHLYPGIFTIGQAAMQETAADEIKRQHPKLREFLRTAPWNLDGCLTAEECDDFVSFAKAHFGDTLDIEGPHKVAAPQINKAFSNFAAARQGATP